ncbi:MAG TPA: substrate-binding domain-containing protein [Gryllotalpicola sp.]
MKIRNKVWPIVAMGAVLAASLTGCDSKPAPAASGGSASASASSAVAHPLPTDVPTACKPAKGGSNGKLLIGVVELSTQGSFFGQVDQGMQDVATAAGVEIQIVDGKLDPQVQSDAVDNLVTKGINVLLIDAINSDALAPAVDRAVAAGIPVVTFDGPMNDDKVSTFVGVSNSDGGKQIGDYFLKNVTSSGEIGEIGALNSSIQIERQKAFENTVKAAGVKIGTVVDGQNDASKAQTAAENLFTGSPDLKYVYATGLPALDGAVAAARSQNKTKQVQLVGWDLSANSAQGIKDGFVKAVLQQDTFGEGQEAAKAGITLACGGSVGKTIPVPTHIVTADNLDQYAYFLGN